MYIMTQTFFFFSKDDCVCFEINPIYDDKRECESGIMDVPRASLMWIGDESSRPKYHGLSHLPEVSQMMNNHLSQFLKKKLMDEKMFQSLVSFFYTRKRENLFYITMLCVD